MDRLRLSPPLQKSNPTDRHHPPASGLIMKWKRLSTRDAHQQLHFDEYNSLIKYRKYPVRFEYFEWLALALHHKHRRDRDGLAYCPPDLRRDLILSPY